MIFSMDAAFACMLVAALLALALQVQENAVLQTRAELAAGTQELKTLAFMEELIKSRKGLAVVDAESRRALSHTISIAKPIDGEAFPSLALLSLHWHGNERMLFSSKKTGQCSTEQRLVFVQELQDFAVLEGVFCE